MAPQKSAWTDHIHSPISVLNHAKGLHLDRFTSEDLDLIAGCDDVLSLSLRSSRMAGAVDLARIAHIRSLHFLYLERLNFTNLAALRTLPHLRVLTISDAPFTDLDALNGFAALDSLTLRRTKLRHFPAGLDLPLLDSLSLSENGIADVSFAPSYLRLSELDVDNNKVRDLAPLATCASLTSLNIDANPISGLAPLAGMKFERLRVDQTHAQERESLQLLLPEEPYVPDDDFRAGWRVAELMLANAWPQLYAITDLPLLADAFSNLVHGHYDEETVRGVLAHPADGAFAAMVASGLRPHYAIEAEMLVEVLSSYGERIIAPLTECFHAALARPMHPDVFYVGKLEAEHALIMRILLKVAAPAYADLFLAFFNDRDAFSETHLHFYKKLLDVVARTEAPQLTAPIIDLLRFDTHIMGGDAAYMKKIFKAVGQLGGKSDAVLLARQFNAAAETRPDVVAAYDAAVARLEKKKG